MSAQQSDIVLAERGTYMKELKKERDQAQKFKDLEEKLKRNKATILSRKMADRQGKEEKLAKQLADEEARSRVWGGIHFEFESLASKGACGALADYVADNVLRAW